MTTAHPAHPAPAEQPTQTAHHHLRRMTGRDPHERGRTATPLELLFDLTFVIAVGTSAHYLAEALAEGHIGAGIGAFAFTMWAAVWAWINFTWFASAFDTDDWAYRLLTMVQMAGVVVLALGMPRMFHSIIAGHGLDNGVMVAGYVVMRVALVAQWLRAAQQSPQFATIARRYAYSILAVQVLWVALVIAHPPLPIALVVLTVGFVVELAIPPLSERGRMTPWHPHHIAERYSLFVIIALGEGVVGTVASSTSALGGAENEAWNFGAVIVLTAGIGLTFAMWWVYFAMPFGEILARHPRRCFGFGYGHMVLLAAIAATGAGLDLAGLYLDGRTEASLLTVVLSLAVPVAGYLGLIYWMGAYLVGHEPLHVLLLGLTALVIAAAIVMAIAGVSLPICALVVMLAPVVSVVGFELAGYRHVERTLGTAS